ncbi:nonstructural protein [Rukutama virus]|uniref:Nonstructural protein n=1 Tax=Rukutama virus TaxID=1531287 RepID=A0A076JP37_9VIRU|nr:nonstructural protein [Rukutama virus]AII79360.1 nonstructural protein [Rukutama virus]
MHELTISNTGPFEGFTIWRGPAIYPSLWDMLDMKVLPASIGITGFTTGVIMPPSQVPLVQDWIVFRLATADWKRPQCLDRELLRCMGWPYSTPNTHHLRLIKYNEEGWELDWNQVKPVLFTVAFGQVDKKARKRLYKTIDQNTLLKALFDKIRKRIDKSGLSEMQINGFSLFDDISTLMLMDLQERYRRMSKLSLKRYLTLCRVKERDKRIPKRSKTRFLWLQFHSDLENMKKPPNEVDLTEHYREWEDLRTASLNPAWGCDWPSL